MKDINLELDKMQAIIARGQKELTAACYLLLEITNVADAKKYLNKISDTITVAGPPSQQSPASGFLEKTKEVFSGEKTHRPVRERSLEPALQVAISHEGLKKLKISESVRLTFSREFLEGMADKRRSVILGDEGYSDPRDWKWGGPKTKEVHLLLLCYALNDEALSLHLQKIRADFTGVSVIGETLYTFDSKLTESKTGEHIPRPVIKEHFGFRDGISTPIMEGLSKSNKEYRYSLNAPIKAGEFVLGYPNEYQHLPESPMVPLEVDPDNFLPLHERSKDFKDLGKNGTYLVFRQIRQNVFSFWNYLKESREPVEVDGADIHAAAITLGAKMIGRWPEGASLANHPSYKDRFGEPDTDFLYNKQDKTEVRCPYGAHIRRSNPRDQIFSNRNEKTSKEMVRKHQLLRRGRIFGKPLVPGMEAEDMLAVQEDDGVNRGLYFICLNTDISKQFEFVQNVWINNPVFADLYNDRDPILSSVPDNEFTCQADPVRRKYKNMPQFTWVEGGGYFFLPSIPALKFIANY